MGPSTSECLHINPGDPANSHRLTARPVPHLEPREPRYTVTSLVIHPGVSVAFDLVLWVALFVGGLVATASATYTFQWNAAQWYDDATSGHDGYYTYAEDGGGRIYIPPKNATICSGFDSCAEQAAFTDWTHHRAVVELLACAFTWVAV